MQLTLLDYWRSGTSHRTRIALELKGVQYERRPVDLRAGAQAQAPYRAQNPQALVPTLLVDGRPLTHSPAILVWLEEAFPAPPLLPKDAAARALVRAICAAVACDIHPLGNLRVLKHLREEMGQPEAAVAAFAARWIKDGLNALEALIARHDGEKPSWAFGDAPSLADCCLVPQLYAAEDRYGIKPPPRLQIIAELAAAHPAFIAAHPKNQSDASK
ncbi:MAG: maleylacetoacetate isomerase [Hyphomonadaceae bacterium]